jgi:hypothetical protein
MDLTETFCEDVIWKELAQVHGQNVLDISSFEH